MLAVHHILLSSINNVCYKIHNFGDTTIMPIFAADLYVKLSTPVTQNNAGFTIE